MSISNEPNYAIPSIAKVVALQSRIAELEAENLEQARLLGMSAERELALRAKVERLRGALAAYSRLTMPHVMALAQLELLDEPLKDDEVLYSFMGSGASDRVTVGDLRKAQDLARAALKEIDND